MKIVALVTARGTVCIALFLIISAVVGFLVVEASGSAMTQLWQGLGRIAPPALMDLLPELHWRPDLGSERPSFSPPLSGWARVICMAVLGTCVLAVPMMLAAIAKAIWGKGRGVFATAAFLAGLWLGVYQPGSDSAGWSISFRSDAVRTGVLLGICLAAVACILSDGWGALRSAGTGRLCMLIAGTVANVLLLPLAALAAGAGAYGLSICFGANIAGPGAEVLTGFVEGGAGVAAVLILAMAPAALLNSFFRAGRLAFAVPASLLALYPAWQHGIYQALLPFAVICWGTAYVILCGVTAWLLAGAWAACLSSGLPDKQAPQPDADSQAAPLELIPDY